MLRRVVTRSLVVISLLTLTSVGANARTAIDSRPDNGRATMANPAYCIAIHNIGKIAFGISNNGTIGDSYTSSGLSDCFTGERVPPLEYPKGSNTRYLFGAAFWIGAVINRDTLVSTGQDGWSVSGAEFHPDDPPFGNMIFRSTIDPSKPEFDGAVSEQDYIAVYTDTFTTGVPGLSNDVIDNRPHQPLNIEVTQRSYAWSYSYAEDFVLFDFDITNIGLNRLKRVFMGIYVDADVHSVALLGGGAQDDVTGFLRSIDASYLPAQCPDSDIVNLAWIADNDGDLNSAPGQEVPHVTGMRVVRTPSDSLEVSYNWWVGNGDPTIDFGPQTVEKFRDLGTGGLGTPEGDRNKYWFLSNGEFDYDQPFTSTIDPVDDSIWLPPNQTLINQGLPSGFDTRYLLSFGPFDIEPGQTLPLSFAYVAGEDFHTSPDNINNLPDNPEAYYEGVDFGDLGLNATWADWIYDNPGVDSDSDGFAGVIDTCYTDPTDSTNFVVTPRKGDGVPDFRGASPPPAPAVRVLPAVGKIDILWNGVRSETTVDNFSQENDFEGYRVYVGRDERRSSFSLVGSFDQENYNKFIFQDTGFVLLESPFTLDELRCLYAPGGCDDETWHPLDFFNPSNAFRFSAGAVDSFFYFQPQDFNRSTLASDTLVDTAAVPETRIEKVYPFALEPTREWIDDTTTIPTNLRDSLLTEDGRFKFYEYRYTIDTLLPTVPYFVNVTAFDYGSPQSGLPSLETSPTVLPKVTYALKSTEAVQAQEELDVFIYPNPYRLDAGYRNSGFEGRGQNERNLPDERARRIHFANLPPKCTIKIFTIDGDLVQEINHDMDPANPLSNHDTWDLVTRNTQQIVSGLYYWTVETPDGRTQIGKLVVIM